MVSAFALSTLSNISHIPNIDQMSIQHHELPILAHVIRVELDTVGIRKRIRVRSIDTLPTNLVADAKVEV